MRSRQDTLTPSVACLLSRSEAPGAAVTIAAIFAAATSTLFIGRFANVPKPQSGFRKISFGA